MTRSFFIRRLIIKPLLVLIQPGKHIQKSLKPNLDRPSKSTSLPLAPLGKLTHLSLSDEYKNPAKARKEIQQSIGNKTCITDVDLLNELTMC